MSEKYYITTPIYYPSGKWHIGTCYTTVICDAIARFKRMQGFDVFYLTGTDEHGQKIEKVSAEAGTTPKEYVDKIVNGLKDLWTLLDISYDKFIRTTDDYHKAAVQKIFNRLYEQGDIYKGEYEGWYCSPCESFWTESQLKDGKCPDCGRPVEKGHEQAYFFKLSKYRDRVIDLLEKTDFLQPATRVKEMVNNFLKVDGGLQDLCVSRNSFTWGIQVPFDPEHIIYVWVDALTNYITALGYGSDNEELFEKYWPCDLHLMGKEIVRFHSIIWPAILMALDLPLPKKVYGHGWLMLNGDKMSKSKGNVVDPLILSDRYGVDAVRYYLLREIPFGQDGAFSNRAFLGRINGDLANDLGNLVSRTTAMTEKYFGGIIPAPSVPTEFDNSLISEVESLYGKVSAHIDGLLVPEALEDIFTVIRRANKYIDETCPWILAKSDDGIEKLKTVIYNLLETIRVACVLLSPFLTKCTPLIFDKLGIDDAELKKFDSVKKFGALKSGGKVDKGVNLFNRYDIDKEVAEMEKIAMSENESKEKEIKTEDNANTVTFSEITIDDFAKINLRVGKVIDCEKVPKADKLLKLTVDLGEENKRTIVSGIAMAYTPEEMVDKSIVVVANLKPVKLRGILSEGMILCASDNDGKLCLVSPIADMATGSEVR